MKIINPSYKIESEFNRDKILKNLEFYGRNCYKSENKITAESASKFIKSIVNSGHLAVIEHEVLTVRFITSRAVSHQLVRSRIASFLQESQRYVNYGKENNGNRVTFIKPSWVSDGALGIHDIQWCGVYGHDNEISLSLPKPDHRWFWNCAVSERDYLRLLNEQWVPEEAREVLNNSTKTEIITTANLREWRHIFEQRCEKHAQSEIRYLMTDLLNELKEVLPEIFGDLNYE